MAPLPSIPLFKVFMPESAAAALKPVLESGRLATGSKVAEFESGLAAWLSAPNVVALNDASGALMLALYLSGVRPGDEVITSPLACAATISPIANLFARPVWCDINPLTGMPDAAQIAQCITPKTKAILLFHWSGDVADIGPIAALAKEHNLKLISDATEALGAEYQARRLGGEADFTIYSFYATKHITTGEGAALVASDPQQSETSRHLRRFGIDPKRLRLADGNLNPEFDIPLSGFNLQMNEIPAAIGIEQLLHLDRIISLHRANGEFYEQALRNIVGLQLLKRSTNSVSGYWTYSLLAERRDDLIKKLLSSGIGTQRLHLRNDGYSCFNPRSSLEPNSPFSGYRGGDRLAGVAAFDAQNFSIPCGWWVGETERERIVECLRSGW